MKMLCIFQFGGVLPAQIGGSLVLPCLPNYPHPVKGIRLADIPCLPNPSILAPQDRKNRVSQSKVLTFQPNH